MIPHFAGENEVGVGHPSVIVYAPQLMTVWIADSSRTSLSFEEDGSGDICRVVQACSAGGGYARRLLPACGCFYHAEIR